MAELTNSSNVTSDGYHLGAVDAGTKLGNHVILIDASGNVITALPVTVNAGTNIIGQVKLTDGTDALLVNTNGSINIVPVDASGAERFTSSNPGAVAVNGSFPAARGLSTVTKPTSNLIVNGVTYATIPTYSTYLEMDTGVVSWWNDTSWVVF